MRDGKLIFFALFMIMIMSFSNIGNSQTGFTYTVKKGDKNTYTFSKFLLNGNSEYQENVTWNDQSSSNITIKKGTSITLEICNVTSDPTNLGAQTVFAKSSVWLAAEKSVSTVTSRRYWLPITVSSS